MIFYTITVLADTIQVTDFVPFSLPCSSDISTFICHPEAHFILSKWSESFVTQTEIRGLEITLRNPESVM
jgi:hypothetical protein